MSLYDEHMIYVERAVYNLYARIWYNALHMRFSVAISAVLTCVLSALVLSGCARVAETDLWLPKDDPTYTELASFIEQMVQARYGAQRTGDATSYAAFFTDTAWKKDGLADEKYLPDLSPEHVVVSAQETKSYALHGEVRVRRIWMQDEQWHVWTFEAYVQRAVSDVPIEQHVATIETHEIIYIVERDDAGQYRVVDTQPGFVGESTQRPKPMPLEEQQMLQRMREYRARLSAQALL